MPFITFEETNFTVIIDENGEPWWIAKEICDYLERGRDTLIRQVG
jgi:prophage antirepressor-like protein